MRWNATIFRLSASVALGAFLGESILPPPAMAQPSPPPLPQATQPASTQPPVEPNQADPPERVGRIARISGAVSFHNPGDTQWTPASVNYPVSTGNDFWTEPAARTQLEVSDSRIALAGGTEFDVATLDANGLQGIAARGETYLHLRDLAPGEAWSVQTPRGLVRLSGAGRYDVVVGTTDDPTLVTVLDGSATIEGPNLSLQVAANQTAALTGSDNFQGSIEAVRRDPFVIEMLNQERPPAPTRIPEQITAEVTAMPGGDDLVSTGNWSDAPEYGQVWYPPVQPGWVPYRHGHWAFVAPWGWTWVDDAPWGFAPFHYGRWIEIGGRWAWTPGTVAVAGPPVYAPALVTFIGVGAGIAIGAAIAAGSIGWIPLGPREAYHPWYHASDNYVRQVNVTHVTNVTNISNTNVSGNNFVNRNGATSVPVAAMTGSRPIAALAQPVSPQQFAAARPVFGQQPIQPTAATAGITPVVPRQFNLAPAGIAARPAAPGPVIRAQAGEPPNGAVRRPELLTPGGPARLTGSLPATTVPGRPAAPALATPNERPAGVPTPAAVRPPEPAHPAAPNLARLEPARPEVARPEVGRPAAARPEVGRPEVVRPEPGRPEVVRPAAPAVAPRAAAPPEPRPMPPHEPAAAPRPAAPPEPHPAPRLAPAAAPRAVPPPEPHPAPRVEPAAVARPAPPPEPRPAPRPEAVAAPQPRPEPPPQHAAAPPHQPTPEREKKPGER